MPSFLKALYITEDLEYASTVIHEEESLQQLQRQAEIGRSKTPSQALKDFTFRPAAHALNQPLKTTRERESVSSIGTRPSSAIQVAKPPRDRSNPAQSKVLQQNNYFQIVKPGQPMLSQTQMVK